MRTSIAETVPSKRVLRLCQGTEEYLPPRSKKRESSEGNSGSSHPYGRYGNAGKPSKTISTTAILRPVKDIFEKRAATVEVDEPPRPNSPKLLWTLP